MNTSNNNINDESPEETAAWDDLMHLAWEQKQQDNQESKDFAEREAKAMEKIEPNKEVITMYGVFFRHPEKDWELEIELPTLKDAEDYVDLVTNGGDRDVQGVLAKGEFKIEPINKEAVAMPQIKGTNTMKEVKSMYIYETYINLGNEILAEALVMTNMPKGIELQAYNRFVELTDAGADLIKAEKLVMTELGIWIRVKTLGQNYFAPFLDSLKGEYRLERIKLKTQDDKGRIVDALEDYDGLEKRINLSTRSWSSSTTTQILFIKGVNWEDFDKYTDCITGNSKKFAKRANEYARTTKMAAYVPGVKIHFLPDHELGEGAYDGHSIISFSFFRKTLAHMSKQDAAREMLSIKRNETGGFIFRLTTVDGLFKGDCHVVSDAQLFAKYGSVPDVVTHECNLKPEFASKMPLLTLTAHHPHHIPNVSLQLLSWAEGFIARYERLITDYKAQQDEFDWCMEAGVYPVHLLNTAPLHDEDDNVDMQSFNKSINSVAKQWTMAGMDIKDSTYLVRSVVNGWLKKQNKAIQHMRAPMPWASYVHCITVAMLEAGGWDLSEYDTSKKFWHAESGRMAWPTKIFIDNYKRHGGDDLDDSFMETLRIMELTEALEHVEGMPNMAFTIKDKDWCVVNVSVRSPNGLTYFGEDEAPGEYSISHIDLGVKIVNCGFIDLPVINFPLYNVYGAIPMITMANAPKVTHVQEVEYEELPTDTDYEMADSYSKGDAIRQMRLALANPGIGSIINPMIVSAATLGTYPKRMPAPLEQLVDAHEQTPSFTAFEVSRFCAEDVMAEVMKSGLPISNYIAYNKMKHLLQELQNSKRITLDTPFDKLVGAMVERTSELRLKWIGAGRNPGKALTARKPITQLMEMDVPEDAMAHAKTIFDHFGKEMRRAPKQNSYFDRGSKTWVTINDPYVGYASRMWFIQLNNDIVKMLLDGDKPNWRITMVALYQLVVSKTQHDNVLYQTADNDTTKGVFNLFMQTLKFYGVVSVYDVLPFGYGR